MEAEAGERSANLLLYGFLQSCTDQNFRQELEALGQELPVQVHGEDEGGLETDGAGQSCMASTEREESLLHMGMVLAHRGGGLDSRIHPSLVSQLAEQITNPSLSEDDRRRCLAATLQQVMQGFPEDTERDQTMLLMTMLMAKRVAHHRPCLLHEIFHTVVKFIIQNLFSCLKDMISVEAD